MKRNYYRSLMFVVMGTMLMSCSKEDPTVTNPDKKLETAIQAIPYPLSFRGNSSQYEPGINAPNTIFFPMPPDNPWEWPSFPYEIINTPTPEYLKETCLVDVSHLENDKTYTRLKHGSLTIGFFGSASDDNKYQLVKLKSNSETGWNSQWGVTPYVESENPDVFYANISRDELVIYFSKPLIEFGFEAAPNHKDYNHRFGASYGDWIFDTAKGVAGVPTRSPSGARLFAVKAKKPFTMVTVRSGDSPTDDLPAEGLAMANFRYKLAK